MSGHSSRWTHIQMPNHPTLHHTRPLTSCRVAVETCSIEMRREGKKNSVRGGGGEISMFRILGPSHGWLISMNTERVGHERHPAPPPPPISFLSPCLGSPPLFSSFTPLCSPLSLSFLCSGARQMVQTTNI